jgi:hypothetical protein
MSISTGLGSGCVALGAPRAEFTDVSLPATVAANEIDGMLKGHLIFSEQGPVNFQDRIKHHQRCHPGKQLAYGKVI